MDKTLEDERITLVENIELFQMRANYSEMLSNKGGWGQNNRMALENSQI